MSAWDVVGLSTPVLSFRCREQDFLKKVHDCVDKGGKVTSCCRGGEGRGGERRGGEGREGREEEGGEVRNVLFITLHCLLSPQILIPVFALGRAQELCILLESYW